MAAWWCSTTRSTWQSRRGLRWNSARSRAAASARRAGSDRPRRRGRRSHYQRRTARRKSDPAARSVRDDAVRLPVCAGRLCAVPGDQRTDLFPGRFRLRPARRRRRVRRRAMSLIHEIDYGTPASKSERQVTLTIDGFAVTVPEGTSIMRAAMALGIKVPKLCAYDMVEAFGSCRLCLVEIEGRAGTPASCTTPVAEGIKVTTQNQ